MSSKFHFLGFLLLLTVYFVGCGGSGGNSLATESGEMTPEEYRALQDQSAAGMNDMPAADGK